MVWLALIIAPNYLLGWPMEVFHPEPFIGKLNVLKKRSRKTKILTG